MAQVYSQIGDSCPDLDDPTTLEAAFRVTQELLQGGHLWGRGGGGERIWGGWKGFGVSGGDMGGSVEIWGQWEEYGVGEGIWGQ